MNSRFNYGSVFKITREDTLESINENLKQMSDSGFNTVVIWPAAFWWEEKSPDYPFATGKKVLEFAEKYNLKIVMELGGQLTSMEYAPDFLMKEEYNALNEDGHREFGQGSFGFLNYYHPEVRNIICEHYKKVALAYKDYPSLLAYDIFNETMFRSFDDYTLKEFRGWLKNKYGTIEKLNEIWERTYSSFEQVNFEKWKWMSIMPVADYNAFRRESVSVFLKDWYNAVKEIDNIHPIMADNVYAEASPLGLYPRPQDDFGMKESVDEIGMSFYPKQVNGTFEPALRLNIFDSFYSATKNEGFWIAEMQTHNRALFDFSTCVSKNELKQWCLEGYSAGAKSLIYWMWRPFNKGIQTLGRGLVNYKNKPTERLELASELSHLFAENGIVKPIKGEVAVVYDPICEDFARILSYQGDNGENIFNLSIFGAYKAFLKNNIKCDVTTLDNIDDYKVIILSNHLVISHSAAEKLKNFVEKGGIIIADGQFGALDELSLTHSVLPAGKLNSLVGEEFFDYDNKSPEFEFYGEKISGVGGRLQMHLTDGKVLAEFLDGLPAVVEKTSGKGKIITFNTSVWYGYTLKEKGNNSAEKLAEILGKNLSLSHIKTHLPITVRLAENNEKYLIFLFNYTDEELKGTVTLENPINKTVEVNLPANDAAVITVDR